MSRDLTPREHYSLSKYFAERGGPSSWDVMESTVMHYGNESHPLYSNEELARRKQFPLFGFLINRFEYLFDALSKTPGGIDVLKRMETDLASYIETGAGEKSCALIRWFEGNLDENFYYGERNEELFIEEVLDFARETSKASLDSQIASADARAAELKGSELGGKSPKGPCH